MNYIILGGAVYTKRGRFARKGQMVMVLSLQLFMLWEHLPKLWENNYHNYCIDRKSFKVTN